MPKRSITDEEIGLIKAMLARGMANKDIQFFFNRQDRPVNSGRITGIKAGSYGPAVPSADDASLTAFLANFNTPSLASPVMAAPPVASTPPDPMDDAVLRSFFAKDADGKWRCVVGETDEYECKEGFDIGVSLKTIAGFANHLGGYLFYGVRDKPDGFAVCGLKDDRFVDTDPNVISQSVRAALAPTPRFQVASLKLDGLTVGVLFVESHPAKPVIASKTNKDVREGTIYFRYNGETRPISYPDLRALLDDRDRQSRMDVLPAIQSYLALGPKNAMVLNLADGRLEDGERPIIIDQALVDRIKFIREGEFNERDGAETLRLIGDVTAATLVGAGPTITVRTEVTEESIIRNFVGRVPVDEPLAYVRQASHEQSYLYPVFYYLNLAGQSRVGAIADLKAHRNAKPHTTKNIVERLQGKRTIYAKAGGKRLIRLARIRERDVGAYGDVTHVKSIVDALTGLTEDDKAVFDYVYELLALALEYWVACRDRDLLGLIRKAASRLDELIYGPLVSDE